MIRQATLRAVLAGALVFFAAGAFGTGIPEEVPRLRLATTTSTENSGLLAELLPPFEVATGIIVDVIAVGTGAALELGRNGDVDVVMVHAPALEEAFVSDGYGVERVGFMYNDFVLLGPPDDPAGARSAPNAAEAFSRLATEQVLFVSRSDNSGTHAKERSIWASAGIEPEGDWYREAGQGMGAVLTMANNEQAYVLADRGTFLAYRSETDLEVLVEGDPELFNPYAVIAVNPERHRSAQFDLAKSFIEYLVGSAAQATIRDFRVGGEQLFVPDA